MAVQAGLPAPTPQSLAEGGEAAGAAPDGGEAVAAGHPAAATTPCAAPAQGLPAQALEESGEASGVAPDGGEAVAAGHPAPLAKCLQSATPVTSAAPGEQAQAGLQAPGLEEERGQAPGCAGEGEGGAAAVDEGGPAMPEEEPEPGFQSGLGIRKALRLHWGATVKLWDEGLRDLSDKVKGMQPRSPPPGGDDTGAHPRLAPEGDDTGAPARPAPGVAASAAGACGDDGPAAAEEEGEAGTDDTPPEAGEGDAPAEAAAGHDPWSPVVRPLSKAMEGAKSMGIKLADVWDIHDIFDDVKQQRDYWRRRREEKRAAAAAAAVLAEEAGAAATPDAGAEVAREEGDAAGAGREEGEEVEEREEPPVPTPCPPGEEGDAGAATRSGVAGRPEVLNVTPRQAAKEGRRRQRFFGSAEPSDPAKLAVRWKFGEPDPATGVPRMVHI